MNGVVKWLFMFVFGFIAAFSFMFFVGGSLPQEEYDFKKQPIVQQPGSGLTLTAVSKYEYHVTGKKSEAASTTYNLYNLAAEKDLYNLTLTVYTLLHDVKTDYAYVHFHIVWYEDGKYNEKYFPDVTGQSGPQTTTIEIPKANIVKLNMYFYGAEEYDQYIRVVPILYGTEQNETHQNMLTWFTNVVNSTRQQSFWDFVKEPIQRFIDKMSYFDSLEKPSFVEVLTAIWNVFLLILSPIEIIGRALWWLALVLYDLIPLLLSPTWV